MVPLGNLAVHTGEELDCCPMGGSRCCGLATACPGQLAHLARGGNEDGEDLSVSLSHIPKSGKLMVTPGQTRPKHCSCCDLGWDHQHRQ